MLEYTFWLKTINNLNRKLNVEFLPIVIYFFNVNICMD